MWVASCTSRAHHHTFVLPGVQVVHHGLSPDCFKLLLCMAPELGESCWVCVLLVRPELIPCLPLHIAAKMLQSTIHTTYTQQDGLSQLQAWYQVDAYTAGQLVRRGLWGPVRTF